ncbi:recombinase family protein [Bacillus massiliigorillae]|uniref:recombinase family protein n=1 Tax=Bacillus massiliigorillae TaxID=1243664 RepID=UPI00039A7533|nr:recombinase family protein [Bacillus massiliigorillae]
MHDIKELLMDMRLIWGYARTSGVVNSKESIPNQCRTINTYADERNLVIQRIWIDEIKTGTNTNRDGYQHLLSMLEEGKVHLILVTFFDRLSRQAVELIRLLLHMQNNGIECIAISEDKQLSLMSLADIASVAIQAEEENKARAKRLYLSRMKSKNQGEHINAPPFGYTRDENRQLTVNPEEAKIVKCVFNSFHEGETIVAIQKKLVASYHEMRKWHSSTIQKMLIRRIYTGKKYRRITDEEKVTTYEKYSDQEHEAIITEEMFLKVASKVNLSLQKSFYTRKKRTKWIHTLKEVLTCPECLLIMRAKEHHYRCVNNDCNYVSIRKDSIEPVVFKYIKQSDKNATINSLNKQREFYTNELNNIEKEKEYIMKQFAINKLSEARFKEKLVILAQKSKKIKNTLDFDIYLQNQVPYGELIDNEMFEQLNKQLIRNKIKLTYKQENGVIIVKEL